MMTEKELKVIEAAQPLLLRYGFARITMNDIAVATGISRPALYLVFANKEEIFLAVFKHGAEQILAEIAETLPTLETVEDKLHFAFDRWIVQPYLMMIQSPDARELVDCTFAFVQEEMARQYAEFEALLAGIIEPLVRKHSSTEMSPAQLAHLLIGAVTGFKKIARDVDELQQLIRGQLSILLAALGAP